MKKPHKTTGLSFHDKRGTNGRWMAYKDQKYLGSYKLREDGAEAIRLGRRTEKAEEMLKSTKPHADEHYNETSQKHLGAKW